jgi:hypothetical protein
MQTTAQLISPPVIASSNFVGSRGGISSSFNDRAKSRRTKSKNSSSSDKARIIFRPGVTSKQVSAALEAERKNFYLINDAARALGCAHVSLGVCDTTRPPTSNSILIFAAHIASKLLRDPTGKDNLSLSMINGRGNAESRGAYRPPRNLLETFAASIIEHWYRAKLPTLGSRQEKKAAIKIQSVIRMFIGKKELRTLKAKKEARLAAARKRFAVRRVAANYIVYALMANAARRIYKRKLASALTLQAFWRGASCLFAFRIALPAAMRG